jgi:hypothetical protein
MRNKMKSGLMLGVNPNAERQVNDFYATDPKALETFLNKLKEDGIDISHKIWECACGQGHLSEVLKKYGHEVKSTDLIDRGYGEGGIDFLEHYFDDSFSGDILTNPPFKLAECFVERAFPLLEDSRMLFLFLKIQFLEGQRRKELFKKYPPKYVYVYSSRQLCCKDGEFEKYTATTQCYAWYVWQKGFRGETIVRWI